jgi:branched-chain amino acid transport system permease protein
MSKQESNPIKTAISLGLIAGIIVLYVALVGMVNIFNARFIIKGLLSLGQAMYLMPFLLIGYTVVRRIGTGSKGQSLLYGVITGIVGGVMVTVFTALGQPDKFRNVMINASPDLFHIFSFGVGAPLGLLMPILAGAIVGVIGAGIFLLPLKWRKAIINGLLGVITLGILRDLIVTVISAWGLAKFLYTWYFSISGLTVIGAIVTFVLVTGISFWQAGKTKKQAAQRTPAQQRTKNSVTIAVATGIMLVLPLILGIFFSEILDNVGLYILMGLGLNIVVGYAGLLDLGYVAFYAIGAYTMGILTSPELGFYSLSFWQALPFALATATLAGILLGLPVLRMRGDYLAIVTLGFGEIIRIIVLSDWLRPFLGGTQGIQQIAHAKIGSWEINTQQEIFYLILVGIGIVAFVAWRLKDSRLGRSWMALREDEDVAQAMGINLVITKLSAFAVGALFSGLAGALFASKLSSAYPHSFNLLVSINVLSLIIVGGIGSIPGVFVGSLVLIGLPDLLREFAEFRYLVYGALLIIMMLIRPEGLWPEARRKLELHEREEADLIEDITPEGSLAD